jgi:hypothetical protein
MTAQSQSTRRKLSLLRLAEELGSVSKACRLMGYHRDSFYEIRRAFQVSGVDASSSTITSGATRVIASAAARQHRRSGKLSAGPNYHPFTWSLWRAPPSTATPPKQLPERPGVGQCRNLYNSVVSSLGDAYDAIVRAWLQREAAFVEPERLFDFSKRLAVTDPSSGVARRNLRPRHSRPVAESGLPGR